MIYKIVAVISVIFLIIFGLIVYSAVTLPAKTLVDSTSAGSQQVISTHLSESALLSIPRPAAQLPLGLQESLFVLENRTPTGESLFVYEPDLVSTTPVVTTSPACKPSVISAEV